MRKGIASGRKRGSKRKRKDKSQKKRSVRPSLSASLCKILEEAARLRSFARSMQESAGQLDLSEQEKNDVQQVIDWTNQYADSLDPLSDLPQSVSEFVRPEEAYSWLTD